MEETEAVRLLTQKAAELERLPQKQDFEAGIVSVIKAKLGPWPRALEKAGLKEVSLNYQKKKARQKTKRMQSHKKKNL